MSDDARVAQIRRFNRTVTERVGALNDHFLSRDRPLGAARLLWEIGIAGRDVRGLRASLGLDSGYLSRLLRSLESEGLVTVDHSESDRRVRNAQLTKNGRSELSVLDRRSDELARSFLDPLSEPQRERLVGAMAEVERLLTASMVEIAPTDPEHRDAQYCLAEFFAEIDRRFEAGFDPALSISANADELRPPCGIFLVARLRGDPIGCGALEAVPSEPAQIKRMWVAEPARGLGVGRRLLAELEALAADHHPLVRLETNGALTEAVAMYRAAGYAEVEPFNDERYAHHWFEKRF